MALPVLAMDLACDTCDSSPTDRLSSSNNFFSLVSMLLPYVTERSNKYITIELRKTVHNIITNESITGYSFQFAHGAINGVRGLVKIPVQKFVAKRGRRLIFRRIIIMAMRISRPYHCSGCYRHQ